MQIRLLVAGIWGCSGLSFKRLLFPSCGAHPEDLNRPIADVMQELRQKEGESSDAFCHFTFAADWFKYVADTVMRGDYDPDNGQKFARHRYYPEEEREYYSYPNFEGGDGNLTTYGTYGGWTYDDLYCYSLGALKNMDPDMEPGHVKISDYDGWASMSEKKCAKIQDEYSFPKELLTVGQHVSYNNVICKGVNCAHQGGCPAVTVRDFKLHMYQKCALGTKGAGQEFAYCYSRGCLLPGGMIGHGSDCAYEY